MRKSLIAIFYAILMQIWVSAAEDDLDQAGGIEVGRQESGGEQSSVTEEAAESQLLEEDESLLNTDVEDVLVDDDFPVDI